MAEVSSTADRSITLSSGASVPSLCFGGGMRIREGDVFAAALEAGYRFFDTAFTYRNDHLIFDSELGRRLVAEQRDAVAVCSKTSFALPLPEAAYEALERMGLEYLDVLLLHHPINLEADDQLGALRRVWTAMEQLVDAGLVQSLGLSNTGCSLLRFVLGFCRIPPAVDQVEFHPYMQERELLRLCDTAGIRIQAYCPLGSPWRQEAMGREAPTADPVVLGIAGERGRTPSQVILRWLMDKGVIPVVSATKEGHMKENLQVFDFRLTEAERHAIDALDRQERIWRDPPKLAGLFGAVAHGVLTVPEEWPR